MKASHWTLKWRKTAIDVIANNSNFINPKWKLKMSEWEWQWRIVGANCRRVHNWMANKAILNSIWSITICFVRLRDIGKCWNFTAFTASLRLKLKFVSEIFLSEIERNLNQGLNLPWPSKIYCKRHSSNLIWQISALIKIEKSIAALAQKAHPLLGHLMMSSFNDILEYLNLISNIVELPWNVILF